MAAIFIVSSLPNPQIGGETPDYALHTLEYFLLALLLIRLFLVRQASLDKNERRNFISWRQACLFGMIIAVSYGVSDEIHQYFVPGRYCSLYDVFSDTAGAILAYGVACLDYFFLNRYRPWITTSLKRFRTIRSVSYAAYRFK
jgi:VanZ family protein